MPVELPAKMLLLQVVATLLKEEIPLSFGEMSSGVVTRSKGF